MQHTPEIYEELMSLPNRPFMTGSYIVNPDKANDIDIVLLNSPDLHKTLRDMGFVQGWGSYKESRSSHTLASTWRKNQYNLLVAKDIISYTMWEVFTNIISHPDYPLEVKSDRVKLHEIITSSYKENHDT